MAPKGFHSTTAPRATVNSASSRSSHHRGSLARNSSQAPWRSTTPWKISTTAKLNWMSTTTDPGLVSSHSPRAIKISPGIKNQAGKPVRRRVSQLNR